MSQCLGVSLCAAVVAIVAALGSPAHAQLGRATRPNVTPPQGPVRQVIFKNCTSCHGIDDYAYHARDRAAWDALLTAKHDGLAQTMAKSAVRTMGTTIGKEILRGVLGSIFGGSKRR